MTGRYAAPQLLNLGPPPRLASAVGYEAKLVEVKAQIVVGMRAIGLPYDVQMLETDSASVLAQTSLYLDTLRLNQIDDAVAQTFLGSATDAMLEQRAADYGVVRRVILVSDPNVTAEPLDERPASDWDFLLGPPRWVEPDESLRFRAQLAWEAQSTAGPEGSYIFHALDAHPDILDAVAYGPESGHVGPGEALVVIQSRSTTGLPTPEIIDVVAARFDAYEVIYADGTRAIRPVRDDQSVRPLGARVTVAAAQPVTYTSTATLYLRPNSDSERLRALAEERLIAYQERRRRIGLRVSREARIAVLSLADENGLPVVEDLDFVEADVVPGHMEIAVPTTVTVTAVMR